MRHCSASLHLVMFSRILRSAQALVFPVHLQLLVQSAAARREQPVLAAALLQAPLAQERRAPVGHGGGPGMRNGRRSRYVVKLLQHVLRLL